MFQATLLLLLFASGPLDELAAAHAARPRLPPSTIFVSMLGTPIAGRADLEVAFDLALNQTAFRRKPVHLTPVPGASQTLYRIDAAELEWSAAAANRLIAREPYFYTLDASVPVIRADWFVRESTFGETYYDLLQFGKNLQTLEKRIGLDRKSAENLKALHGARVVESGVALNPRAVARFGTPLGFAWATFDVNSDNVAKNGNPFEKIDELTFPKIDATEIFGVLPNGLFWWALANGQGVLQAAAPTNVAADRRLYVPADKLQDVSKERPSYRVVEVQNAHSCMGCHANGLRSAQDFVSSAVAARKLTLKTYDTPIKDKIEDFFDARMQAQAMVADSLIYTRAVERITGLPALEAGNLFARVRWKFAEENVSLEQAARELNVTPQEFDKAARAGDDVRLALAYWFLDKGDPRNAKAVLGLLDDAAFQAFLGGQVIPLGTNSLRSLVTGTAIPRDIWENGPYQEAALIVCYGVGKRAEATRATVKERFAAPPAAKTDARKRSTDRATGRAIEFNEQSQRWEFSR